MEVFVFLFRFRFICSKIDQLYVINMLISHLTRMNNFKLYVCCLLPIF